MSVFGIKVDALATGATANAYITVLAVKMAATTGHRARLRKLIIGGAGGAAQDIPVSIRLRRSDNTTDGTSTSVNVNTIGKLDSQTVASNVAAIGKNFTVEPTTFDTGSVGGGSINSRGTLVIEWAPGEGPLLGSGQTLAVEAAPGTANAVNLEAALEWEE